MHHLLLLSELSYLVSLEVVPGYLHLKNASRQQESANAEDETNIGEAYRIPSASTISLLFLYSDWIAIMGDKLEAES